MPKTFCHIYTLIIVIVGWIFFASPTFGAAFNYLKVMFTPHANTNAVSLMPWLITFAIGIVSATPLGAAGWGTLRVKHKVGFAEIILCIIGFALCMASLITESYNPFLYFRF